MEAKSLHKISFVVGLIFVVLSSYQSIILAYPHFYTTFTIGSWLVLDWIDYKLTSKSILTYFFNSRHRDAFAFFFVVATFFCFVVDYVYGVKITGVWQWVYYEPIHFVRMYLFMNVSFLLSMYELYRIFRTLLKHWVPDRNTINLHLNHHRRVVFYGFVMIMGGIFMLSPLYMYVLNTDRFIEYIAALPFIGMLCIVDASTFFLGGEPVVEQVLKLNKLLVAAVILTIVVGGTITEMLNLFGGEWRYNRIPFMDVRIMNVPVFVMIGWLPLVLSAIALVNLIKRFDFIHDARQARPKRRKR